MFSIKRLFGACAALSALCFLFSPAANAQNFSTLFAKSKVYDYNRYYGPSSAGGSIHLDARGDSRIVLCAPHVIVEVTGEVDARKRARLFGFTKTVAQIHAEASGQSKAFDQSGNNIVNIGSKGRFLADRFIRLGGVTVWSPSTYKKEFTSASQVWPMSVSKNLLSTVLVLNRTTSVYGIPVSYGLRLGGGVTVGLGLDLDPSGSSFEVEAYGEAKAFAFATAYGGIGIPGLSGDMELEAHFMTISARPSYSMIAANPGGTIRVTRAPVELLLKVCANLPWPIGKKCATLWSYTKSGNSWTRTL